MRHTLAKRGFTCVCCANHVRVGERVFDYGKGEKYCEFCQKEGEENNPHDDGGDGESRLRMMEDFAAYQCQDCVNMFWSDRDCR